MTFNSILAHLYDANVRESRKLKTLKYPTQTMSSTFYDNMEYMPTHISIAFIRINTWWRMRTRVWSWRDICFFFFFSLVCHWSHSSVFWPTANGVIVIWLTYGQLTNSLEISTYISWNYEIQTEVVDRQLFGVWCRRSNAVQLCRANQKTRM